MAKKRAQAAKQPGSGQTVSGLGDIENRYQTTQNRSAVASRRINLAMIGQYGLQRTGFVR